jgi:hypothetical protein
VKRISSLFITGALLTYLALALTACSHLQRSPMSGYAHQNHEPNFSPAGRSARGTAAFAGIGGNAPKTAVDKTDKVHKAEANLEGRREREQYFRYKPHMRDDLERLEFLSLPSFNARQRWLEARGINDGFGASHPPEIQALVEINDITLGMTKQAVRDSWGVPEFIEVAANPIYGNERWFYREETSSPEGYKAHERWVYFESGRVSGWQSR